MPGIVVGVDDSSAARAALSWALQQAARAGTSLTVVTAIDPLIASAVWDTSPAHNSCDSILAGATAAAKQLVREANGGAGEVDVDVRAVIGRPVHVLVEAAEGADLVVVGSRGNGALHRLLLGSTSAAVAAHAPCSVMIVRPTD